MPKCSSLDSAQFGSSHSNSYLQIYRVSKLSNHAKNTVVICNLKVLAFVCCLVKSRDALATLTSVKPHRAAAVRCSSIPMVICSLFVEGLVFFLDYFKTKGNSLSCRSTEEDGTQVLVSDMLTGFLKVPNTGVCQSGPCSTLQQKLLCIHSSGGLWSHLSGWHETMLLLKDWGCRITCTRNSFLEPGIPAVRICMHISDENLRVGENVKQCSRPRLKKWASMLRVACKPRGGGTVAEMSRSEQRRVS